MEDKAKGAEEVEVAEVVVEEGIPINSNLPLLSNPTISGKQLEIKGVDKITIQTRTLTSSKGIATSREMVLLRGEGTSQPSQPRVVPLPGGMATMVLAIGVRAPWTTFMVRDTLLEVALDLFHAHCVDNLVIYSRNIGQ